MLTAAALSVTVGVLIGIVLIIGNRARQSSEVAAPGTTAESASVSVSDGPPDSDGSPLQVSAPNASSPAASDAPEETAPLPVVSTAAAPSTGASVAGPTTAARPSTTHSTPARTVPPRPSLLFTTVTVAPPTSRSAAPTTSTASTTTPPSTPTATRTTPSTAPAAPTTATSPSTTAPPAGAPAAGRRCAALGDKASAAGGSTLYCQTDFSNGFLAWRAVVDGGGCLSKKLTGIGTDGHTYVCRPDRKGLDYWRRG